MRSLLVHHICEYKFIDIYSVRCDVLYIYPIDI